MFQRKQKQKQTQIKLDRQQEVNVQLLKDQIDSIFDVFDGVIKYLKSNKIEQSELITYNDCAVSLLKLFGVSCREHVDNKEKNTLIAAFGYFDEKKQSMDPSELRIVKDWLNYTECALLGKKLNKLQISQITIDAAHKNMQQGGLTNFLDKFIGANHSSNQVVENAERNKEKLRMENEKVIHDKQQKYTVRQQMIQCPDQNKMYNVSGGGQNIQFGSSLYHPSSKYYNQRPLNNNNNNMKEEKNNDDDKPMMDKSYNSKKPINAYVKKAPPHTITRNNKPVKIKYPYPCQIIPGKSWDNGQTLGVIYSKPNDDLKIKIDASNLVIDRDQVSRVEQMHISRISPQGLGYPALVQSQPNKQQKQYQWQ